jgi:hypothetical protein
LIRPVNLQRTLTHDVKCSQETNDPGKAEQHANMLKNEWHQTLAGMLCYEPNGENREELRPPGKTTIGRIRGKEKPHSRECVYAEADGEQDYGGRLGYF